MASQFKAISKIVQLKWLEKVCSKWCQSFQVGNLTCTNEFFYLLQRFKISHYIFVGRCLPYVSLRYYLHINHSPEIDHHCFPTLTMFLRPEAAKTINEHPNACWVLTTKVVVKVTIHFTVGTNVQYFHDPDFGGSICFLDYVWKFLILFYSVKICYG